MSNRDIIQDEALTESLKHFRCGLAISMRVGKTRIGVRHLMHHYTPRIRVLVVAPNKPIYKSWKDEIEVMSVAYLLPHIKFSSYRSLNKLNPQDYDMIYLDEFQAIKPEYAQFLNNYQGRILGLTGTPPLEFTERVRMVKTFCPIVFRYTTDDAVGDGILNDYRIYIHLIDLDTVKNVKQTGKHGNTWYNSELNLYNYWCEKIDNADTAQQRQIATIMLMKAMMEFPSKVQYTKLLLQYIKDKVIVFANTKEQADHLCDFSYHSDNPLSEENLALFNDGVINQMSCVLQLNAGITIKDLKACVVMHSYSNNSKLAQRIARCLGLAATETAQMHILAYRNSMDVNWILNALENFNSDKIQYIDSERVIKKVLQTA